MSAVKTPFEAEVFEDDLKIERDNLDTAFIRQASMYAYYASRHAEMLRQEARLKMFLEITEAKLDKSARDRASAAGSKITENQIRAEIILSPDYISAQRNYSEAKGMTALAASAVEAFRQRRDMLIQLGANSRAELQGGPVIRENDRSDLMGHSR